MITPYTAQQTINDFGLIFSNLEYSASIAASTDTTFVVPDKAQRYKAVITVKNNTWIAKNAAAAIPAGATFALTNSKLITAGTTICREVKSGDILHFFSPTAATDIGIELYAMGTNN